MKTLGLGSRGDRAQGVAAGFWQWLWILPRCLVLPSLAQGEPEMRFWWIHLLRLNHCPHANRKVQTLSSLGPSHVPLGVLQLDKWQQLPSRASYSLSLIIPLHFAPCGPRGH